jgi:hypothetical protein
MPSYSNIVSTALSSTNVAGKSLVFSTINQLPLSGNEAGAIAYVQSNGRLYIWNNGWYSIGIVNSSPIVTGNYDPFTAFEKDGTPIVLELEATDPEGIPLTWSYSITKGSLGNTATIAQNDNVFTITPSQNESDEGEFEITFAVSDGVAITALPLTFRLIFKDNWRHGTGDYATTTFVTGVSFGGSGEARAMDIDGNNIIIGDSGISSSAGRAWIYSNDPFVEVRELICPNPASTTSFGYSVGISGDYCAVSQYGRLSNSGVVYIYDVDTGTLIHTLDNPNAYGTSSLDYFGWAMSLDGDILAVSAMLEDDATSATSNSGRVYIYSVSSGELVHTLDNPNPTGTTANDNFGRKLKVAGNYVIAYSNEDVGATDGGGIHVFNATTGELLYSLSQPPGYVESSGVLGYEMDADATSDRLVASNRASVNYVHVYELSTGTLLRTFPRHPETNTAQWGYILSISGYTIITGYVEASSSTAYAQVFVYHSESTPIETNKPYDGTYNLYGLLPNSFIYNAAITGWAFKNGTLLLAQGGSSVKRIKNIGVVNSYTIDNPNGYNTPNNDYFGYAVGISGKYAIATAYQEDDAGGVQSGKAYILDVSTGNLIFIIDNPNGYNTSASDYFGTAAAISGNYAIVGTYSEDDIGGLTSGKAYIYKTTNGTWSDTILLHTLDNPGAYSTNSGDYFGHSVAISGNYAIVGAYFEDDAGGANSGKAYIFDVTTGALVHTLDNPNAYATSAEDRFGVSVAISGNYVVVGAYAEDDTGSSSGKAYIFDVLTGDLVHTLDNPNPSGTSANDWFGYAVAISGNYAIVGAYGEDVGGSNSGSAYIFDVTTGLLLHTLNNPNSYSTSADDQFGEYVAMDGNYAVVGAKYEDTAKGLSNGTVYVFDVRTGELLGKLANPTSMNVQDTGNGLPVGISGSYIIAGHNQGYTNGVAASGFVRIWEASY